MSSLQVLLVAGTHGNEINAPWLFDQWDQNPGMIDTYNLKICRVIGNPLAYQKRERYVDRDLNRSFSHELLSSLDRNDHEIFRARNLIKEYGPQGFNPSKIVIDFHSTTASMGSSLVVYGRRPVDLALASLVQNRLGLPIYLHECEPSQKGFLVESWPCGFVVEIGPVPQGVLHTQIIDQILLVLGSCLKEISKCKNGSAAFPSQIIVHRHLKNIDFPRDLQGKPIALIHPSLQGKDWYPIKNDYPLFRKLNGENITFSNDSMESEVYPVFINEAAYVEKNIAMAITAKQVLSFQEDWKNDLFNLFSQ